MSQTEELLRLAAIVVTVLVAIIGLLGSIVAFFPSRITALAARKKAEVEEMIAEQEQDRKDRDELRTDRDYWRGRAMASEKQDRERLVFCQQHGDQCFARANLLQMATAPIPPDVQKQISEK